MADTKLSALTELAAGPATTDEFYINDGGASKRIVTTNLLLGITNFTELSATPAGSDELYVNDGGVSKKIQYSNLAIPTAATQTNMEAEDATGFIGVTPDLVKNSPGVAKFWAYIDRSAGTPSLSSPSYNVTSLGDDGAGQTLVTIATDFSTAVWVAQGSAVGGASANQAAIVTFEDQNAGTIDVEVRDEADALLDTTDIMVVGHGDQ